MCCSAWQEYCPWCYRNSISQCGPCLHPRTPTQHSSTCHTSIHTKVAKVFSVGMVVHHSPTIHNYTQAQPGFSANDGTCHDGRPLAHHRSGRYKGVRVDYRCHGISSFSQLLHELFADCVVSDGNDGLIGDASMLPHAHNRSEHMTTKYTLTHWRSIVQKTHHFKLA